MLALFYASWLAPLRFLERRVMGCPRDEPLRGAEAHLRNELARETLEAERLRAGVLVRVFTFAFAFAMLSTLFFHLYEWDGPGARFPGLLYMALSASLAGYETIVRRVLGGRLQQDRPLVSALWFVNAFVEVTAVTLALVLLRHGTADPLAVLLLPAALVYATFILLATLRMDFRVGVFTGLVAAAQYLLLALDTLADLGGSPAPVPLSRFFYVQQALLLAVGGAVAGLVARRLRGRTLNLLRAHEERGRALRLFGQHTDPAVVDELLRSASDPASRRRQVAILFVDIRGFTRFSEQHPPEAVVDYLNAALGVMIEAVHAHHGLVHQLLGDGLMAIFGAPIARGDDRQHALDAARQILERVGAESAAGRIPPTRLSIGLHAGEAVTGLVGSTRHREYKVTGDVVNVAARVEQLTRAFGAELLVTEAVWTGVDQTHVAAEDLGWVPLRGRGGNVHVYRLA